MKRIEHIKLYTVGEVVEILNADFNHQTTSPVLCRKITMLTAYVIYNKSRYIPEDIIGDLIVSIRKREIRFKTEKIIAKKLESIKNFIKVYEQKHKQPSSTKEINNINTNEILEAIIQLKEEIIQLKEEIQKMRKQEQEELKEKNKEITEPKEMMQKK
ncbi:hypothetical protein bcCo53_001679 (plasmid) [Borrelia coriaceae]|uniref:Uncharacterized protein n=1 Tax=Borrelia coriaceae ATCC 43381 TaxID=1408429 RepID=W5SY45_9SPIR|nr:hypothetical protein [Borrelia coriaceae]AHH11815.1 Hypothetical protein BCO_0122003 [Borrelia coriaceae ATCC 43381]UPA17475.1 hypothetical protein bcCo53_001679 [Borrelia coriaceae]